MGEFPSGQRGQTVNLLRFASMVRIRPPPPQKTTILLDSGFLCCRGYRIRKAALRNSPVDCFNRRGFAAAKRIRPPLSRVPQALFIVFPNRDFSKIRSQPSTPSSFLRTGFLIYPITAYLVIASINAFTFSKGTPGYRP